MVSTEAAQIGPDKRAPLVEGAERAGRTGELGVGSVLICVQRGVVLADTESEDTGVEVYGPGLTEDREVLAVFS